MKIRYRLLNEKKSPLDTLLELSEDKGIMKIIDFPLQGELYLGDDGGLYLDIPSPTNYGSFELVEHILSLSEELMPLGITLAWRGFYKERKNKSDD